MDSKGLYNWVAGSSWAIRIATAAVVVVWTSVVVAVIGLTFLLLEKPSQTLQPTPGGTIPTISVEPAAGPPGTAVSVRGEGWEPGSTVLVYLMAPGETQPPAYAVSSSTANAMGRITTGFVVPSDTGWENQGLATVLARATDSGAAAQAFFSVARVLTTPTATPKPVEPTATMTATPTEEIAPTPTATPRPPTVTAITDLNIRAGPGMAYSILGVLRAGQSAEAIGLSADSNWWQIVFSGIPEGRGWVSAYYVVAENTENVTAVEAPSLPATSTPVPTPVPTPAPVVITDWRGEYFTNPHLSGEPVLVRSDLAIGFDWGGGSPGPGVPADNFSARWSRGLSFSAGTYRFYARVDDGVRLWIDGSLIIDQWHDSAPTLYSADIHLTEGWHSVRMEYYERTGGALAQLAWERLDQDQDVFPDWKAEYYDNRKLKGNPVLVRNEDDIDHNWGSGSPGGGVPNDDFSARWTRKVNFKDAAYLFRVQVDDGVRLWVGDDLVIDGWEDGSSRWIEEEQWIEEGKHRVKVEYYEQEGGAQIEVSWERIQEPSNQSPTAAPGGPYTANEGSFLTLDGSGSTDSDGSIVNYEWDYDYDGSTFTVDGSGQAVSTRYPDGPATVTVALRVTDDDGASHLATTQITVQNVAPTAEAGGPYSGQVGELISMAGTATDPGTVDQTGLTYLWDFGDGTQGNGPNVGHSFDQARQYTLTLTVTDKDGAQGTDTATLEVTDAINQSPTVTINAPGDGETFTEGDTISFSGTASDVEDGDVSASLSWVSSIDGEIGSGESFSSSDLSAGVHTITASATDRGGLTGSDEIGITVNAVNTAPTVTINAPGDGETFTEGDTISFSGTASDVEDGDVSASLSWVSSIDGEIGSGESFSRSDLSAGVHTITATATDSGGLTGSDGIGITVNAVNTAPTVTINAPGDGETFTEGDTISFSGTASDVEDGDVTASLSWVSSIDGEIGSGESFSRSDLSAGMHTITATATDSDGLTGSDGIGITVNAVNTAPTVTINAPGDGETFTEGDTISFSGGANDVEDGDVSASLSWASSIDGAIGTGASFSSSNLTEGVHTITATATDSGGLTGSSEVGITVNAVNTAPTVTINAPGDGETFTEGDTISFSGGANDVEDGDVSASLSWVSSIDGAIGTGGSFSKSDLSLGTHTITATATDSGALTASTEYTVQVVGAPIAR